MFKDDITLVGLFTQIIVFTTHFMYMIKVCLLVHCNLNAVTIDTNGQATKST